MKQYLVNYKIDRKCNLARSTIAIINSTRSYAFNFLVVILARLPRNYCRGFPSAFLMQALVLLA